jgi:hypothetical protein
MSMNLFAFWARLGNKSKEQLQKPSPQHCTSPSLIPPAGKWTEKVTAAEAADLLLCHDSLDLLHSADVGQPESIPRPMAKTHPHACARRVRESTLLCLTPTTVVIPPYNR